MRNQTGARFLYRMYTRQNATYEGIVALVNRKPISSSIKLVNGTRKRVKI